MAQTWLGRSEYGSATREVTQRPFGSHIVSKGGLCAPLSILRRRGCRINRRPIVKYPVTCTNVAQPMVPLVQQPVDLQGVEPLSLIGRGRGLINISMTTVPLTFLLLNVMILFQLSAVGLRSFADASNTEKHITDLVDLSHQVLGMASGGISVPAVCYATCSSSLFTLPFLSPAGLGLTC